MPYGLLINEPVEYLLSLKPVSIPRLLFSGVSPVAFPPGAADPACCTKFCI